MSQASDQALSVTQLLRRMKNLLEVQLGELWIEGEVSNLRKQPSGHWYFSLKDDGAQISCAMFGARKRIGAEVLEDGAKVRVFAQASVYEARGQLQIIVQKAVAAGAGDLQARFEALKRKLQAEGLFETARKKPMPAFPRTIGLITSEVGAALQDMLKVLGRRAPWVQPVLLPVRVQGKGAEHEIAAAIRRMSTGEPGMPACDLLIVGRGGGSIEDLWCFNEEVVARAIAACPLPVVSAVGHEIDFTISDFVADLRAPTPSAAIEMVVPDGAQLAIALQRLGQRARRRIAERFSRMELALDGMRRGVIQRDAARLLAEPSMRLDMIRARIEESAGLAIEGRVARVRELKLLHRSRHPLQMLGRRRDLIDQLWRRMERSCQEWRERRENSLARIADLIRTLGPQSAFQRGFSIAMDEQGKIIRSAAGLQPGQKMVSLFADGRAGSEVVEVRLKAES
ncbi:MAG TPA: exodeoxyribonuclease VII large subunit [Luteolibacter sp.]|nr:exodeoxyribonuclease VII large subunit [Luteolibacter sp.]